MKNIQQVFKAYDIRGIYPDEINEDLAYKIGQAYLKIVKPQKSVAVGMDVRTHSGSLKKALIQGIIDGGTDVVDIGLVSTEMLYFAVGHYGFEGGIQVTASHNTAEYNGFKMTRAEALPISSETGIFEMRDLIIKGEEKISQSIRGKVEQKDILSDFAEFVLGFIDQNKINSFRIAHNPNFGFEGVVLEKVKETGSFNFELHGLNHIPDGSFPKGQPDPLLPENRTEFSQFIKNSDVDLGVAWDADADRVFFFDNKGKFIDPYYINTALAKHILKKNKGGKIVYDPRYTWALIDAAKEAGGEAVLERVGHSFIKARMRKEDALFAGESSGHIYFKDFWYADSGIIPLLIVLEIISSGVKLEDLIRPLMEKYFISGEINSKVEDKEGLFQRLREEYKNEKISEVDGISVDSEDWRFNVRASNTEPLVRLNIEGKSQEVVEEKKKEVLGIINR